MRRSKWRIAGQLLCTGVLVFSTAACDRAYRPTDRGDAELKAEDDAARRAARNQAAHILVKVDDDNVDQRLSRLEEDVEMLKASLNKAQTDLELLKARSSLPPSPARDSAPASPRITSRLPPPVGGD